MNEKKKEKRKCIIFDKMKNFCYNIFIKEKEKLVCKPLKASGNNVKRKLQVYRFCLNGSVSFILEFLHE